ncbi:hypothetical protein [Corallococcus sp. CA047B]|uniref:hypothetical protein n=1 Tax=Corallococcus sp. CA047B TaxID=2316729 RepID=UPI0011C3FB73|nr:hypothetical protein [Corallococcus sp. CA047B]
MFVLPLLTLLACGNSLPPEEGSASCEPEARGLRAPGRSGRLEVARPLDAAEQAQTLEDGARVRTPVEGPWTGTPTLVWPQGVDLPLVGNASPRQVPRHGAFEPEGSRRIIPPAR